MSNLKQVFGCQLRAARKGHSWTQTELATKAGLSLEMIGMLERGQAAPSLATIEKLSDTLNVHCTTLLDGPANEIPGLDRVRIVQRIMRKLSEAPDAELGGIEQVIDTLIKVMSKGASAPDRSQNSPPDA